MKKGKKRGFTLTEVIISITIMSVVGLIIGIIFNAAFSGQHLVGSEADLQSEMRNNMQTVNRTIENATGIFVLDSSKYTATPSTAVGENSTFIGTEGWNYIGLSSDKKAMMSHTYDKNTKKWVSNIISSNSLYYNSNTQQWELRSKRGDGQSVFRNMELNLEFTTKVEAADASKDYEDNRLLEYELTGHYPDTGNNLKLDTAVMGLNSKQIFSRVGQGKKGIALAYRNDTIEGQINTAISFVFDVSGSMEADMKGGNRGKARITILKEKAKEMVNSLSSLGNVSVNLVGFSSNARYIKGDTFYDLKTNLSDVETAIDSMTTGGATNPGDGLRYGMLALNKQPAKNKYVVLLSDGVPTSVTVDRYRERYASRTYRGVYDYYGYTIDLSEKIGNNKYTYYNPKRNGQDQGDPAAIEYAKRVASQRYAAGVKRVSVIGFSAVRHETALGTTLSDEIEAGGSAYGLDSNYISAESEAGLKNAFSDIKAQIEQDLWFVTGP